MSELWKQWEGQVIDRKYQLRRLLGSTDHSAVFYAEYRDPETRKAAVKFLAADLPHSEQVLADWKRAQQISHANLLPIYSVGRCQIEDMDVIYAAMEYADENLAEILPHRALTSEEARDMLSTVVEMLVHLHVRKLTHGHIKPSNIMAVGDQLKLTSDTIEPLVEAREMRRKRDVYDAPEIPAAAYTPAADIWSLGVTLVEALTQQPAFLPFNENAEPVISPSIREPFREIAANALRRDPKTRWTSLDVASKLNPQAAEKLKAALAAAAAASAPTAVAAASTAGSATASAVAVAAPASASSAPSPAAQPSAGTAPVSPLAVPLSKEPAAPLGKQPTVKTIAARPPMPPPPVSRPEAKRASRQSIVLPNYVLPLFAALLIVVAVIALPKILHRQTQFSASNAAPAAAVTPKAPENPVITSGPSQPVKPAPAPAAKSDVTASSAQPAATTPPTTTSAPTPAPATLHTTDSAGVSTRRTNVSPDQGEVLDKILPKPASAALASIQGTVRVVVRVKVDAAGNVSEALLEKAGPSRYFAEKSLEAAKGWVFLSPIINGHSESSEWLIRFEYTPSGVNAYPKQAKP